MNTRVLVVVAVVVVLLLIAYGAGWFGGETPPGVNPTPIPQE
jgi:hypothetical protein